MSVKVVHSSCSHFYSLTRNKLPRKCSLRASQGAANCTTVFTGICHSKAHFRGRRTQRTSDSVNVFISVFPCSRLCASGHLHTGRIQATSVTRGETCLCRSSSVIIPRGKFLNRLRRVNYSTVRIIRRLISQNTYSCRSLFSSYVTSSGANRISSCYLALD